MLGLTPAPFWRRRRAKRGGSVRITLNGEAETYEGDSISIRAILDRKRWSFPLIIAKLNGEPVPRNEYESRLVREGDALELYHLVSGG